MQVPETKQPRGPESRNTAITIFHAATHAHNIGDGALVVGLQTTLKEDVARQISFKPFDVLDAKLSGVINMLPQSIIDRVNQDHDLLLIGGGGMIEGGRENNLNGINFNFDPRDLSRVKKPVVLYALGVNQFRNSHFHHADKLCNLLLALRNSDALISVRDDGSSDRLIKLVGQRIYEKCAIRTIPDPALFLPHGTPNLFRDRKYFLVQLAGDRIGDRLSSALPMRKHLRYRSLISELAKAIEVLSHELDLDVVLCPHLTTDVPIIADLLRSTPNAFKRRRIEVTPVLRGAENAATFFSSYSAAEFVIGMRGHSAICAFGAHRPFVAIDTHDKLRGHMREFGLEHYCVKFPGKLFYSELLESARSAYSNSRTLADTISAKVTAKRRTLAKFNREIARRISQST